MYCLRWWLPVFLLPVPAAPPAFLFLFLLSYTLHTRPWYATPLIQLLLRFYHYRPFAHFVLHGQQRAGPMAPRLAMAR